MAAGRTLSDAPWLLVVALASGLAGCAGSPLPMRAVAGTTVALAISADEPSFGGAGIAYGSATFGDSQRGVLGVDFYRGTEFEARVPVKLVTRFNPDPATPAALSGKLITPDPGISPDVLGQVAALVDLPPTLPEGSYDLTIRRYTDATLTTSVDEGPVENPVWASALYVEEGDETPSPTPFLASWGFGIISALQPSHVQQIVPHPQLLLGLPPHTAAATLEIGYPDGKVEIKGAYVYRLVGHGALVQVETVDEDSVRVHVVLPNPKFLTQIALVFENTQSGYAPVLANEFVFEGGTFYESSGLPIPSEGFHPIGEIR